MDSVIQKIGHLTILEERHDKKCDCGEIVIQRRLLLYNGTKNSSCGCQIGIAIKHGITKANLKPNTYIKIEKITT